MGKSGYKPSKPVVNSLVLNDMQHYAPISRSHFSSTRRDSPVPEPEHGQANRCPAPTILGRYTNSIIQRPSCSPACYGVDSLIENINIWNLGCNCTHCPFVQSLEPGWRFPSVENPLCLEIQVESAVRHGDAAELANV